MSWQNRFTDEFKTDAMAQVVDRGYAVSEVAERLGISTKSLYTRKGQFAKSASVREAEADLAAELRRVKKELARVTEERDILKKAVVGSSGQRNGSFEGISRRLEAKRFPGPRIEPKGDLIKVMLSVNG
jgi:transposase